MEPKEPKLKGRPKIARIRKREEAALRQLAVKIATHDGPVPIEEVEELADEFVKEGMRLLDRYSLEIVKPKSSSTSP